MKRFNLKRIRAGVYESGEYYIIRDIDTKFWMVGFTNKNGNNHIDDFKSYAQARSYVMRSRASWEAVEKHIMEGK